MSPGVVTVNCGLSCAWVLSPGMEGSRRMLRTGRGAGRPADVGA